MSNFLVIGEDLSITVLYSHTLNNRLIHCFDPRLQFIKLCFQGPIFAAIHTMIASWVLPEERPRYTAFIYTGHTLAR